MTKDAKGHGSNASAADGIKRSGVKIEGGRYAVYHPETGKHLGNFGSRDAAEVHLNNHMEAQKSAREAQASQVGKPVSSGPMGAGMARYEAKRAREMERGKAKLAAMTASMPARSPPKARETHEHHRPPLSRIKSPKDARKPFEQAHGHWWPNLPTHSRLAHGSARSTTRNRCAA